ncbi:MAG: epoxyqueuosine reductase [Acidimicrobiia bacterium]
MSVLTEEIESLAQVSGADVVAVCDADPFPEARATLVEHKETGISGPLRFTFDHPDEATDIRTSFPWATSLVVLGHDYLDEATVPAATGALVGRFATSDHYRPLRAIAEGVASALRAQGHRAAVLIDDNRLADRLPAIRSGLGWQGRSTMVLAPGHGPWLLLGTVVTDASLTPSSPATRSCGTCTACIPACPTGAITEDGLDARRCLSTWLQTAGSMPLWIRPLVGRRIYGCDECLVACPPGFPRLRKADRPAEPLSFDALLALSDDDLVERFGHWYIPRREGRFLRRNVLVAAGNSGESEAWDPIIEHLDHISAMIRGHAAWALARSGAPDAVGTLQRHLETETVPVAREEVEIALLMRQKPGDYQQLLKADEERRAGGSAPGGIAEPVAQRHHGLGVDLAHP